MQVRKGGHRFIDTILRYYYNNFYLQDPLNRELRDFDYASRGYRLDPSP